MPTVELIAGRIYSAPEIGAYWNKVGDKVEISERNLRDYDVQSGLKREKLKMVDANGS